MCISLKILCGFFFLIAVLFQLISYQPKWFKESILFFFFCTILFFLIYGHSRLFIPEVNSCAAFHVMLPFASTGLSSEQFNILHPLKVIVLLFKIL